jgi:Ca-activated chloride channel family protein
MCEFANPWVLLLALLVPVLVAWWLRRPRRSLRYSDTGVLTGLPEGRSRVARWGGAGLRAAGLLALIVAAAGPRWPDRGSRIETEGIALQMLVDVSGSMAEPDFDWQGRPISRLEAVKKVFNLFVAGGAAPDGQVLEGRPTDLVGLVTFATWPETACPLTLSHSVLLHLLDAEKPRTVPTECRTNIGDAIAWGLYRLDRAHRPRKVMVLLSDGEHNVPPPALTPRQGAQLAANQRVPIYTIDASGDTEVDEGLGTEPAVRTAAAIRAGGTQALQAVAQITGGRYFRARDTDSLLAVCREIDRLERKEIQSFIYQRYFEGYPWAGLAALVCWVLAFLLEATFWQRLP